MANFNTHIKIGISSALIVSSTVVLSKIIGIEQTLNINYIFILIGTILAIIFSLLPDIDLIDSTPGRYLKKIIYGLAISISLIYFIDIKNLFFYFLELNDYRIIENSSINNIAFGFIYFTLILLFVNLWIKFIYLDIKHRGIIHSIPMGIFFSLVILIITKELLLYFNLSFNIINTYYLGFVSFIGYITHLLLDEFYSVDFKGLRIKKSFGTALSIFSTDNIYGYILLYGFIGIFFTYIL